MPCAAMRLGRPVKWIEDRVEHSSRRARSAASSTTWRSPSTRGPDRGAVATASSTTPAPTRRTASSCRCITSTQLPGPYRLRNYHVEFDVVYTNKVQVTPYRGAGRAARRVRHGARHRPDRAGARRSIRSRFAGATSIQPDEFPWDVGLTFQDGGPHALRQRRLSRGARDGAVDDRRRATSARARRPRARRAAISGSASRATSRAPASGRTRAPTSGSSRAARCTWRRASRRRARATRRRSRRSPRRRSAAIPPTSP